MIDTRGAEITPAPLAETGRPRQIPRIFHQTWFGGMDKLGPVKRALIEGCKRVHENLTYMLWTDENISSVHGNGSLVNQEWFDKSQGSKNLLSDISRFEILYAYGGVYADADTECLLPFKSFEDGEHECWAGREMKEDKFAEFKHGLINSANMGCVKHSRAMYELVSRLVYTDRSQPAWISAGPYYFTKNMQELILSVQIMPYYQFFPFHHGSPVITKLLNESKREGRVC